MIVAMLVILGILAAAGLYVDRKSLKERAKSAEANLIQKLLDNERLVKAKLENALSAAVINAKVEAAKLEGVVKVEVLKAVDAIKAEFKSKL